MGEPAVGDVVVIPFRFSHGSGVRSRPAVVAAVANRREVIACQVTSRPYSSSAPIPLPRRELVTGDLSVDSYIRPEKLFTASYTSLGSPIATIPRTALARIHTRAVVV